MTLTHLDTPGWLVLTWKPYMEDTPASLGSTWNGHTWVHLEWTHLDGLYSHGSLIWRTHLQALDPPGMDTSGSTWNGHTWTHLDDIYPHGLFKIIRYTWKVRTHLEALNTGAMEPLMDSSRQLLWILPDPLDLHDP